MLTGNCCRALLYAPVWLDRFGSGVVSGSGCRRLHGFGQKLADRPRTRSSTAVSSVPLP